ncbi:hypothetical protein EMIT0P43_30284 [Pseudomonas jessenii]
MAPVAVQYEPSYGTRRRFRHVSAPKFALQQMTSMKAERMTRIMISFKSERESTQEDALPDLD